MITREMIKAIAPSSKDEIINPLVTYLNKYLSSDKYQVNTYLRICHFLAQAAHESAGFKTLEEYADGSAYEGRKDLGNNYRGDGRKYKGRGIFQLTGRGNYRTIGKLIGVDLENNPEMAATPEISVLTALEYWKSRNLNAYADKDDVLTITHRINGGENGLAERKAYLVKAKKAIPNNVTVAPSVPKEDLPPDPINPLIPPITVAKLGDNSPYIADLQDMLIKKGYSIASDGAFGPMTEKAVKDFQTKNNLKVTGEIDTDTLNKMMV